MLFDSGRKIARPIVGLGIALSVLMGPAVALAAPPDELQASSDMPFLGTVETNAVTGPIEWGGILYIPPGPEGGASAEAPLFLGTVETNAVTAPILIGGILYVPPSS